LEALQVIVERTLGSMGYELVELEMAQNGLLRVFIDAPAGIQIEDCERVSRQLSHVLAVDDVDYQRLEVSSPGLDRPLRKAADFVRFAGAEVSLRLKRPFEGRRNFEGVLTVEPEERFGLELIDDAQRQAAQKSGKTRGRKVATRGTAAGKAVKAAGGPDAGAGDVGAGGGQAASAGRKLVFALDEVDRARLVPKVKF
jgi:ribosome maturation factor RimP